MLVDVVCFSIMYIILLLAFAILMIGAGSPDAVVESCGNFNLSSAADGRAGIARDLPCLEENGALYGGKPP